MALPEHIQALLDPSSYAERPDKIELRQTHISYLLFTPEFVYKVKKPVDFGFLDFTSLEKRRHFCGEEVRLNGRLSSGVYLGVVPVTSKGGRFFMGGDGGAVDYAVKMKRLAPETMLEEMIKKDKASVEVIERAASAIAAFHMKAETNAYISGFGSPEAVWKNISENFSQTKGRASETISKKLYSKIKAYSEGFIKANEALLLERVKGAFIRDCHGDIHAGHISITETIDIIDCIEFNERFRFCDIVSDAAFLSMDMDYLGRGDLSRAFDGAYFSATGDEEGGRLLDFYRCYRAYVRGKVDGLKYIEAEVSEEERLDAYISSRRHFHLSGLYASGGFKPMMIVITGLSGTGKTTLARMLAEKFDMAVFSTDAVRKELAGMPLDEHGFADIKGGIYSDEFTGLTYRTLIGRGISYIKKGRSCVLDGTFLDRQFLDEARKMAKEAGAGPGLFHIIECACPEETARERIIGRLKGELPQAGAASDARWEVYLAQKNSYKGITTPHMTVGTKGAAEDTLKDIADKIFG